jgi:hypothetical protein
MQSPAAAPESTIVAAVRDVFLAPEFNPGRSIWWWTEYIDIPFDREIVRRVLIVVVGLMAIVSLVRYGHRWYLEHRYGAVFTSGSRSGGEAREPWALAQSLAAAGDYTAAAHALYLALLDGLARREQLRLHPSKTVGDYLRELRARSSTLLPTVRDFARAYELIAYGFRECDAERYARLHALASAVVRPNG